MVMMLIDSDKSRSQSSYNHGYDVIWLWQKRELIVLWSQLWCHSIVTITGVNSLMTTVMILFYYDNSGSQWSYNHGYDVFDYDNSGSC